MVTQAVGTVPEMRRNLRVRDDAKVQWFNKEHDCSGNARILNVSAGGLCFETKGTFPVTQGEMIDFDSFLLKEGIESPFLGKLVWSQQKNTEKTVAGVEFVGLEDRVVSKLRHRVQSKISDLIKVRKTRNLFGIGLLIILGAFCGMIVNEYSNLTQRWSEFNVIALWNSARQASLQKETLNQLASVKKTLAETQTLLAKAQEENEQMLAQINQLKSQSLALGITETLETTLAALQAENGKMLAQIGELKSKLNFYERDVQSLDEGKQMINTYKGKIRNVKVKMHDLKRQAQEAKIAALKELDRILLLKGNNGYLVKDGLAFVPGDFSAENKNRVEVNVEFFK